MEGLELPAAGVLHGEFRISYERQLFVGDELRVGGWVAGTETTDEGRLYTFEVYARKGEETVATATAGFLVYEL
jgi:acyl-CoA thioesterase FadM